MVRLMATQSDATPAMVRVEALLARVAAGMTDEQDADWLRGQIYMEPERGVLRAYWVLMSHIQAAREYLPIESRRVLSAQLLGDDPVLAAREQDMARGTWWLLALALAAVAVLFLTGRL